MIVTVTNIKKVKCTMSPSHFIELVCKDMCGKELMVDPFLFAIHCNDDEQAARNMVGQQFELVNYSICCGVHVTLDFVQMKNESSQQDMFAG